MAARAPRSADQRPARIQLATNISRELDRELRAWAKVDGVSLASIVELALRREFRHRTVYRTAPDNREAHRLVARQNQGRKA